MNVSLVAADNRIAPLRGMLLYSCRYGLQLWFEGLQRTSVQVEAYSDRLARIIVDGPFPLAALVPWETLDSIPFSD